MPSPSEVQRQRPGGGPRDKAPGQESSGRISRKLAFLSILDAGRAISKIANSSILNASITKQLLQNVVIGVW